MMSLWHQGFVKKSRVSPNMVSIGKWNRNRQLLLCVVGNNHRHEPLDQCWECPIIDRAELSKEGQAVRSIGGKHVHLWTPNTVTVHGNLYPPNKSTNASKRKIRFEFCFQNLDRTSILKFNFIQYFSHLFVWIGGLDIVIDSCDYMILTCATCVNTEI